MIKNILHVFILSIFSNIALAVEIPADFLYHEKPIDPNCILESANSKKVDLGECSKGKEIRITKDITKNNLVGYEYINLENNFPGYISYEYLGKIGNAHIVHAFMHGGKISRLDYIGYFKISHANNMLELIKLGPEGDRSNGGIVSAKIDQRTLLYDISLTAKLFMSKFSEKKIKHNSFDILNDCAICQFAIAHYKNDKPFAVTLNSDISFLPNDPINNCLSGLHKKYLEKKQLKLNMAETRKFIKLFSSHCKAE